MWYFSWIVGMVAALSVGIINVMWYEAHDAFRPENRPVDDDTNKY